MSAEDKNPIRLVDLLARRSDQNPGGDQKTGGDRDPGRKPKLRRDRDTSRARPVEDIPIEPLEERAEPPLTRRQKAARARADKQARIEQPALPDGILPLPQRAPRKSWGTLISFLIFVALPVILSVIYYYGIASRQYVSDFRFAVRDAQASISGGSDTGALIGLAVGSGAGQTLENYMVVEYLLSEPAVEELQKRIDIRKLYSREDIDWFSRFDPELPLEGLVAYWKGMVRTAYDQVTGISTVRVRAFRAEDALLVAQTLVDMSEELITGIARRPQRDAVRFAEEDLQRSQDRLKLVAADLTRFRDTERVIEPGGNVVISNATLAATLRANLAQLQTELAALTTQKLGPNAPARLVLEARIKAAKEQLAIVENEVGTPRENAKSLSRVVGLYEQLDLERTFAQDTVRSALRNLETARANALVQHLYVVPFVRPVLPQSPTYPQQLMSVLLTAMVCLLAWSAGLLLFRSIREHIA